MSRIYLLPALFLSKSFDSSILIKELFLLGYNGRRLTSSKSSISFKSIFLPDF
jgi:hypothetical protein